MRKITSWDKKIMVQNGEGLVFPITGTQKARLVLWPDGAPDPSTVPHVNERCQQMSSTFHKGEVRSAPYIGYRGEVFIQVMWDGHHATISVPVGNIERIPDAPTVKIGEKTYDLADAVARCEPLEEVK